LTCFFLSDKSSSDVFCSFRVEKRKKKTEKRKKKKEKRKRRKEKIPLGIFKIRGNSTNLCDF